MSRNKNEKKDKTSKSIVDDKKRTSEQALEQLREEVKQTNDQYLRTLAEVENTKKRLAREKEEHIKYASESMIRDLIPIIDSLDQALVAVDKQHDLQSVIQGVEMIHHQILGLLDREGVQRIATIGELFDPHQHEAVAQIDAQNGQQDGEIIEEVHVGYTMHGRVIRPALVKVAKSKDPKSEVGKQKIEEEQIDQTTDNRCQTSEGQGRDQTADVRHKTSEEQKVEQENTETEESNNSESEVS